MIHAALPLLLAVVSPPLWQPVKVIVPLAGDVQWTAKGHAIIPFSLAGKDFPRGTVPAQLRLVVVCYGQTRDFWKVWDVVGAAEDDDKFVGGAMKKEETPGFVYAQLDGLRRDGKYDLAVVFKSRRTPPARDTFFAREVFVVVYSKEK